jgi:hypothetical protein
MVVISNNNVYLHKFTYRVAPCRLQFVNQTRGEAEILPIVIGIYCFEQCYHRGILCNYVENASI